MNTARGGQPAASTRTRRRRKWIKDNGFDKPVQK